MDPGIPAVCPICGSTTSGSLEELQDHLDAHSKQDLIQLLLQQQQNLGEVGTSCNTNTSLNSPNRLDLGVESDIIRTATSSAKAAILQYSTKRDYEPSESRDVNLKGSISSSSGSSIPIPNHSRVLASLQQPVVSLLNVKDDGFTGNRDEDLEDTNNEAAAEYDLVPLATFSVPFHSSNDNKHGGSASSPSPMTTGFGVRPTTMHETHQVTRKPNASQDSSCGEGAILESSCHPDNSLTSSEGGRLDHQGPQLVQEESDNATSQTSIIKYIIDQSGKASDEQPGDPPRPWILSDGRTIPVYSSFTQTQVVPKERRTTTSKILLREELGQIGIIASERAGTTTVSLNLMTDEEIPPRGEISEFEESNTSSLVSEDSKAASSIKKEGSIAQKPKPKPRRRNKQGQQNEMDGVHQFLCYECPVMQKFKSLFELIGHKVKLHPSISIAEQFSDNNASSSLSVSTIELPVVSPVEGQLNLNVPAAKVPKEFFCVYCNTTFDNKISLSKHMETDHGDKPVQPNIFECNTCGKTFQARTNLRKHLLVHKERKHICTVCSKGFISNFKLLEHTRVHTKIYPYKCDKCEKFYRTPSLLNHHAKTVHVPESERPVKPKIEFYCGICHKILRSKRSYFCHTKSHHVTTKKCAYCCETFSRQSVLVRHIRVTHDPQFESSESKECTVCQRKLHPNSLIKHMRIHANEKPYSCQVCSKRFRTYANLSSHSWSHTNIDRPFKCRVCPKSYLFKRTLEHHMMVHKRRTLHYVCNECGVRFTNKVNMKRHLDEHYSEKKYKCKTCGKKFQRNYYLLEHERTHTGLKPFLCNICGKASTTKSNHRAHIRIHDARESSSQEG